MNGRGDENEGRITRRAALRAVAASGATAALVGPAGAQDRSPKRIVGTASREAEREAKRRADSVKRTLDFGDIGKAVAGRFSDRAAEKLRKRDDVRYVEEDGTVQAYAQDLPWGIDRVDADVARGDGYTGNGADIAIIDTGIDDDHPDLQANVGAGKAYVKCKGRNCNYDWSDDNDHGTHCAGIVDAVNNSEGVVGVSTEATLHAVKVLDRDGSGSFSDVAAGIEYTADQGWDVGSLSLGASSGSQTVKDACTYAYNNGVLLVAAAGNDGPCTDCVGYPAAYSTVMAISSTDSDDSLSSFSSTGPEIELTAPGGDVYSTVIGGYDTFSGTSMACPHVSGAGGILMANGQSNTTARSSLQDTAEDIGLADNEQGYGLLDAEAAANTISSSSDSSPTVDSLSLSEAETDSSDAEFDADWQVSDSDDDLNSVDLTLYELDNDGNRVETEDSASPSVSGGSASGTTRLVATDDDGSGKTYEIELMVTDSNGDTDSDTATATESEDTSSGGNAPTVDSLSLNEDNHGGSPHADFDASWSVSDGDSNLDTVDLTLTDLDDGETEDSATVDVSGGSASGTTDLAAKHEENSGHEYEIELVVTDSNGNTASGTATEDEDGS